MKLRYRIAGGILIVFAAALAVFALVISHTSECEPAPAVASDADLMSAVRYRCYGPAEVLELAEVEKPVPADDEVLVLSLRRGSDTHCDAKDQPAGTQHANKSPQQSQH